MKPSSLIAAVVIAGALYYIRGIAFPHVMSEVTASQDCLELIVSTTQEENGINRIKGTVRNNCKRKYSMVNVEFLLDRSSEPVNLSPTWSSTRSGARPIEQSPMASFPELPVTASARNVEPGATAEIETTMPVPRNSSYRVGKINGF